MPDPTSAGSAVWQLVHVVIHDMDFAENDLSHGAGMREPLLAIACGKTKAFGRS